MGLILKSAKDGIWLAGADVRELAALPDEPGPARELVAQGLEVLATLEASPVPTVALIDRQSIVRYAGPGVEDPLFKQALERHLAD